MKSASKTLEKGTRLIALDYSTLTHPYEFIYKGSHDMNAQTSIAENTCNHCFVLITEPRTTLWREKKQKETQIYIPFLGRLLKLHSL